MLIQQPDGSWIAIAASREYRLTHSESMTLRAYAPDGQVLHDELRDPRWDFRNHRHPRLR
jgi:hypothetical protein